MQEVDARPLLLFIAPYFPPAYYGGVVRVYLGLLARLPRFRVVVVTDRAHSTAAEREAWDAMAARELSFVVRRLGSFELHLEESDARGGLASLLAPARRVGELIRFFRCGRREWRALLRELEPDLVVCGGTYSAGWLVDDPAASYRLVNYVHGEELTMRVKPRWLMPWMRRWQMRAIREGVLNIAVSRYTAALTGRLARADPGRIVVLPNFVNTAQFRVTGSRAALRERMQWKGRLVVLTLARLEPRKGIDNALRALALLCKQARLPLDWVYVIAGRGSELDLLKRLSDELGIADHVIFRGFVPDNEVPSLYEAADIFLQPNREIDGDTEGFGVVFLEASGCGLPVIGGTAGGTADAIEEGVTGYRVDGESVTAIADAVGKLAADEKLREQMGAKGAARVAAHFAVEHAAERFEAFMLGALGGQ